MNLLSIISVWFSKMATAPLWIIILVKVTVLLALAWLAHLILKRANPRWRMLLWRGTAIGLIAMPILMLSMPAVKVEFAEPNSTVKSIAQTPEPSVDSNNPEVPRLGGTRISSVNFETNRWGRWLCGLWIFGILVLAVRFRIGLHRIKQLVNISNPAPKAVIQEYHRISKALPCRQKVAIRTVTDLAVPLLTGLRRPILLLPARMCAPSYKDELAGIIVHELSIWAQPIFSGDMFFTG